ncbi:flagellar biosynthesis chaperone FliJ [Bacillus lacus]|uniref:Flagellar FliJ protein n=1 Tax=Metabacillus lacus TaxID=1983721 RepID=A0A7X2LVN3_9BACI|nr:flagellar export protein FliJ [Metabacillus lacus]MRX70595.1 flagellar biosynthesis chaperone FliJ [Metabacillus lacus]
MTHVFKLQKVMDFREKEKNSALADYNQSVKEFEQAAEQLYGYLKKKEVLEEEKERKILKGLPIQEFRHYQNFAVNLEKTIQHYQSLVMASRSRMNEKQSALIERSIELKKYSTIKDRQYQQYIAEQKAMDSKQMDDLSIQAYVANQS